MSAFNDLNGVPGCANKRLETDVLKNEWNWDGFIESDYTAVAEELPPTTASAADGRRRRARMALMAGTDSEMVCDAHPRQRRAAARGRQDLDGPPRRRGAPDPADQVPRRAVREPLRRPVEGRGRRRSCPTPSPRRARPAAARWCCSRTTARCCRSTRPRTPRSSVRWATTPRTCSARGGAAGDDSKKRDRGRGHPRPEHRRATYAEGCKLPGNEPPDYDESEDCAEHRSSPTRSPPPTRPTRSCSRSARRGRTAARRPRAA